MITEEELIARLLEANTREEMYELGDKYLAPLEVFDVEMWKRIAVKMVEHGRVMHFLFIATLIEEVTGGGE